MPHTLLRGTSEPTANSIEPFSSSGSFPTAESELLRGPRGMEYGVGHVLWKVASFWALQQGQVSANGYWFQIFGFAGAVNINDLDISVNS